MPRFYYEYSELEPDGENPSEWVYILYDSRRGRDEFARCDRHDDAEKIVDAMNAVKPTTLGIFA